MHFVLNTHCTKLEWGGVNGVNSYNYTLSCNLYFLFRKGVQLALLLCVNAISLINLFSPVCVTVT